MSRSLPVPLTFGLLVVACLSCFIGIFHPVQNINEGVYARIAQEMVESGDWIIPTLNGVPYLEKPPFLYWLTAAAYAIFGSGDAVTRTAPVIGAILSLMAMFVFARRHLATSADVVALLMFASAPVTLVMTRTLMFDMLLTGLLTWCLVAAYEALRRPRERRWIRLAYAALGLSIMTKGLIALVLVAGILAIHLALQRRGDVRERARALVDLPALGILLLLTLPWHLAASAQQPGFAWFYFINEHVMRFVDERVPHDYHNGPWWYYLPRLLGYVFPWCLVALLLPFSGRAAAASREPRNFLWVAFLVPLVIFSTSGAKANYYMIVGVPFVLLLCADCLVRMRARQWLIAVLPCGVLAVLWIGPHSIGTSFDLPSDATMWLLVSAAAAIISVFACAKRSVVTGTATCAAAALPFAVIFGLFLSANEPWKSSRTLAEKVDATARREVYIYRQYEDVSALPYYLRHPVGVVASRSADLWYGITLRPDGYRFPSMTDFLERARREDLVLVVLEQDLRRFEKTALNDELRLWTSVGPYRVFVSDPDEQARVAVR